MVLDKESLKSLDLGTKWFPKNIHPAHGLRMPFNFEYLSIFPFDRILSYFGRNIIKPSAFTLFVRNFLWCLPRKNDVIWSTNPHSGFNWLFLLIIRILAKKYNFNYEFDIKEGVSFYPRYIYINDNIRPVMGDYEVPFRYDLPIPRMLHSHTFYNSYRYSKILLQIRNPIDSIISRYYSPLPKRSPGVTFYPNIPLEEYLNTDEALYYIKYFNQWGEMLEDKSIDVFVVKYEDLKKNTELIFRNVLEFLNIEFEDEEFIRNVIQESSIKVIRKEEMKKRNITDQNMSKVRKGGTNYFKDLDQEAQAKIRTMVKDHLKYDFGYDLHL